MPDPHSHSPSSDRSADTGAVPGPKPPRRPRYAGKNPRRYQDKYKEHHSDQYPETVAKVLASGKTPAGSHRPIMLTEVLETLAVEPGQVGVDATLGYGGHAQAILERLQPAGRLIGLDADPLEVTRTEARLRALGYGEEALVVRRSNFAGLPKVLAELQVEKVDFVLADLGCSSMQLDDPSRGFTFKHEGPLDMRMNPARGQPASAWLGRVKPEALADALWVNADEPRHTQLGTALAGRTFATTLDLAQAVRDALGRSVHKDEAALTVRRVFQAVRIAINEEFQALDTFLRVLTGCLKAGGRAVILTFHSGEDRRVKKAFQAGERDVIYQSISDRVTVPSPEERRANPRSAPAKLRWAIRS